MRKVLVFALLAGSLFVITFQFSSTPNPVNSGHLSLNPTQSTVFSPFIDPIEA